METSVIPQFLTLDRPMIIFDLETTGLTPGEDRTVEIAYRKIMPDGSMTASVQRLNPGRPIPEDSTAIHGIRDEDVRDMPTFANLCYELWSVFEGVDVGGFNVIGYDLPFLRAEFALMGKSFDYSSKKILDGKVLYHKVAPRDLVAARNLSAAYKTYCGGQHDSAHTAAGDVEVTVKVIEKLLEKHPEFRDWDYLAELHGNRKLVESAKTEHAPTAPKPASLF